MVVVEVATASFPEVEGGEGVSGGVGLEASFARELAGEGVEAEVGAAFDHGEARELAAHAADAIGAEGVAEDFEAEVVSPGKGGD